MNLSSVFQNMKTKQYQPTAKQRLMIIAGVGLVALIFTVYMMTPEVAVNPIVPGNNSPPVVIPPKTAIPSGNQTTPINQAETTIRDPFALLPEAKEQKNETNQDVPLIPNNVPSMIPKSVVPDAPNRNFKLTGIAGTGNQRLAVIKSGDKSNSYGLNEFVGGYKLTTISTNYVILTNADGKLVLSLE